MSDGKPLRVRLTPYEHGGVKTEIDGFELPEVVNVKFDASCDGLPRVTVTMNAFPPFEIDLPAEVTIDMLVPEECQILDITTHSDKGKRSIVARRTS